MLLLVCYEGVMRNVVVVVVLLPGSLLCFKIQTFPFVTLKCCMHTIPHSTAGLGVLTNSGLCV